MSLREQTIPPNTEYLHAEHFRATLPKSVNKLITSKHYDELTLMIESAITVSIGSIQEQHAKMLEAMADELRSQQKNSL